MFRKFRRVLRVAAVVSAAVLISVASLYTANAETVVDTGDSLPVVTDPVYTTAPPPVETTQPPVVYTTAPPVETQPVYTTAAPVYTTAPDYYVETTAPDYYYEPTQVYIEYETEYVNQQEYYGDETTAPTVDQTSLYESDDDIDDTELNKKNWKRIAEELSNSQESDDTESPFNHIKNGDKATGFQAFINNLNWVSTAGIICIILAIISLVVFILFTKKSKKQRLAGGTGIKDSDAGSSSGKSKHSTGAPQKKGKGSHAGAESQSVYVPRSTRSSSDYGDDFGGGNAPAKTKSKKRSSQDTAEINIKRKF